MNSRGAKFVRGLNRSQSYATVLSSDQSSTGSPVPTRLHTNDDAFKDIVSSCAPHRCVDDDDTQFTSTYVSKFSPRSIEACKKEGVQAGELILITLDDVEYDDDESIDIRQLRLSHANRRRRELLDDVRIERQRLVRAGWTPPTSIDKSKIKSIPVEQLHTLVGGAAANMIENEKQRVAKLLSRHEQELEQLVQHEMRQLQIEDKQKKKEEARRKRDEAKEKQRKIQQQEVMQRNREIALRKKKEEERERERRKQLQREMYEKAQRGQREQRARERQSRIEARIKAQERHAHQTALRRRTEAIFNSQQERTASKLAFLQKRDELRRKKNEEAKQRDMAEKAARQQERRDRVQTTLHNNHNALEEKRIQLGRKMETQAKRLSSFQKHIDESMRELRKNRIEGESRRRRVLEESEAEQLRRVHNIIEKNQKAEMKKNELTRAKQQEKELKKESQRLKQSEKLLNVERKKRIDEYKRDKIVQKIDLDNDRRRVLQRVKSEMIQERKRNQVLSSLQKQEILHTFQTMRTSDNWSKQLLMKNIDVNGETMSNQ